MENDFLRANAMVDLTVSIFGFCDDDFIQSAKHDYKNYWIMCELRNTMLCVLFFMNIAYTESEEDEDFMSDEIIDWLYDTRMFQHEYFKNCALYMALTDDEYLSKMVRTMMSKNYSDSQTQNLLKADDSVHEV